MVKSQDNALGTKKAFDKSYSIVIEKDGSARVIFGNGKKGVRPPAGSIIATSYGGGSGEAGNVPSEKLNGVRHFSSKAQAIEFLSKRIMSELTAKLPEKQGDYLVYLDVWERDVVIFNDPTLSETALGGPETNTRICDVEKSKKKKPRANSS
jgi:hypothetical protein